MRVNQGFFYPKIPLIKLDDENSSLKWGQWLSGDEIEDSWLEVVFKAGKDLVDCINIDGRSPLRWLANLEEEEWERR